MTIKRNGDKVILKDGKVSCNCCGPILCPNIFEITDRNVFEITRQEFLQYYNGGIWTINVDEIREESAVDIRETPPTGNSVEAVAQFEFSFTMDPFTQFSCQKNFVYTGFTTNVTLVGTRFVPGGGSEIIYDYPWTTTFNFRITTYQNRYYARYVCGTRIATSTIDGTILDQPTTMIADGNNLLSNFGIIDIYSAILYQDGDPVHEYANNSTSVITMTFLPT